MMIREPVVAILGYHKIGVSPGEWDSWYYVPQPMLERHVALLIDDGFKPLSSEGLIAGLDDPASLPYRSFLITFDDAYRSLAVEALPWLTRNGVPAVVFVPTAYVGGPNEFDRDIEPEEPILSWDELRALHASGVSIQSHGVTHRTFSELTVAELASELEASKAAIEVATGAHVKLISYPYGDPGDDRVAVTSMLETAGYEAAFGYGGGALSVRSGDRFMLPRIAVGPDTELKIALGVSE